MRGEEGEGEGERERGKERVRVGGGRGRGWEEGEGGRRERGKEREEDMEGVYTGCWAYFGSAVTISLSLAGELGVARDGGVLREVGRALEKGGGRVAGFFNITLTCCYISKLHMQQCKRRGEDRGGDSGGDREGRGGEGREKGKTRKERERDL